MKTVTVEITATLDIDTKMLDVHMLSTALVLMGAGIDRVPTEDYASESLVHVAYLLQDRIAGVRGDILALKEGDKA